MNKRIKREINIWFDLDIYISSSQHLFPTHNKIIKVSDNTRNRQLFETNSVVQF